MHALLVSAGTLGNMLPFLGLGKALRARGHRVTLIGSGYCRERATKAGLDFVDVDDPSRPRLMDVSAEQARGWSLLRILRDRALVLMPRVYRLIAEQASPQETVLAAPGWLFGARMAQEKLRLPLASVFLQPRLFRSVFDPPAVLRRLPRWFTRSSYALLDRVIDRQLRPAVDAFRAEIGLPSAERPLTTWLRSPELQIGFFPEWFASPQPDWPPRTILGGFPRYDGGEDEGLDPELEDYLDAGEPPLVFSQASLVKQATEYWSASIEAVRLLNRRAVFLTALRQQLPSTLPSSIRAFDFVPLSQLLPRSAALIHHGGLGTLSHALAAGIPQLTVPGLLDQFDNSRRLLRLGVSANLRRRAYHPQTIARLVRGLLDSSEVAQRCRDYAARCGSEVPFERVCIALEHLHQQRIGERPASAGW